MINKGTIQSVGKCSAELTTSYHFVIDKSILCSALLALFVTTSGVINIK